LGDSVRLTGFTGEIALAQIFSVEAREFRSRLNVDSAAGAAVQQTRDCYSEAMEVHLTPEQQAFVQLAVKSGRYRNAEDAVREAMTRWEEDKRSRAETIAALEEAETDLGQGLYREYSDSTLPQLTQELKAEGRAFRGAKRPIGA
jgi:putative addiction module CopG family antidote